MDWHSAGTRARLQRLIATVRNDTAAIDHLFIGAVGRLTILGHGLAAEAAGGQLGYRATLAQEPLFREVGAVTQVHRAYLTERDTLDLELAILSRRGDTHDVSPLTPDRLLAALDGLEERTLALSGSVQEPLTRTASTLGNLGIRVILGATDVSGPAAGRIALYGRRLKELGSLFTDLAGAITNVQQGILGGLGGLRGDLAPTGAQRRLLPSSATSHRRGGAN